MAVAEAVALGRSKATVVAMAEAMALGQGRATVAAEVVALGHSKATVAKVHGGSMSLCIGASTVAVCGTGAGAGHIGSISPGTTERRGLARRRCGLSWMCGGRRCS